MSTDVDRYNYDLPPELIAQHPVRNRADARLMVVDRREASIRHHHVRDLPELLNPGDQLVLNDTRVIPARLVGTRTDTGGQWQGLYLSANEAGLWRILSKTRGRIRPGERIALWDRQARDAAALKLLEKRGQGIWIAQPDPPEDAMVLLQRIGRVPLPHYIRGGHMVASDEDNYQTVYARHAGSVAAPTAGLHFTRHLLTELEGRGVGVHYVTLHVELDTFRPITSLSLDQHEIHKEWAEISTEVARHLETCHANRQRIVAVGTTSVRVLETAARSGQIVPWQGHTELFIRPPFRFQAIDALMTNFHLPRTSLLVLARTFGGDRLMHRAYELAVQEQYRFFSYGDAMLIL